MKIWIDTEFNEYKGDLISLGMIDENGNEWYEVLDCPNPKSWVAQHVMPHLMKEAISHSEFYYRLEKFLNNYSNIQIIADWPDDIAWFCRSLIVGPGLCINHPPLTFEICSNISSQRSLIPHNALADAIAIKKDYLKSN